MTQGRGSFSSAKKNRQGTPVFLRERPFDRPILLLPGFLERPGVLTGHRQYNEHLKEHGQSSIALSKYLRSDPYFQATAENWESEFLQMFPYVLFTAFLYQKGSSESKKPGELEAVDREAKRSSEMSLGGAKGWG